MKKKTWTISLDICECDKDEEQLIKHFSPLLALFRKQGK